MGDIRLRFSAVAQICTAFVFYAVVGGALSLSFAGAASLEAYGGYPEVENVALSPTGDKIAYAAGVGPKRVIVVVTLADNKLIGGVNVGTEKLREVEWADEDHLLFTVSQTSRATGVLGPRREWFETMSYDIAEKKLERLLSNFDNAMNVIIREPEARIVGGRPLVYVAGLYFASQEGKPALFTVDLSTHVTKLVDDKSPNALDWLIDGAGNVVAETQYNESTQHWSLRIKRDSSWHEALMLDTAIDFPEMEGLSADGQSVLLRMAGEGSSELKAFSLADGTATDVSGPTQNFGSFITDPVTHNVIGGETIGVGFGYTFFSDANRALWRKVTDAFSGSEVELVSWSDDKSKIVVRVSGHNDGAAYELVDLTTNTTKLVGPIYVGIGPQDIAPVKPISYTAADGRIIPAYLTLPLGRPAKGLALIVLPHGGPVARDNPGFDWWAQALASLGYAVLQPQFRGSDGFGWEHLAAGFGQWGRKMQSDLSDGVRALAAQGVIDPKRVCIVGASYGGYAALAGATLDPGVYRCAVSVSGLSDLGRFISWRADRRGRTDSSETRYWDRFMGAESPDDPALSSISPIAHLDKVSVPILLIHGSDDTVVPIEQSEAMADALKKAGKDVSFVTLESEDHWLSRAQTRTEMLTATAEFLEKVNPP